MIQFNAAHFQPPVPSVLLGPLAPSEYLRLRRKAAGLSIPQLVERMPRRGRTAAEIRDVIEQLERPGVRARHVDTIRAIARVLPLDVNVYRQLAYAAPHQQPSVCRGCGCSAHDHCRDGHGHEACSLLTPHICSRCSDGGVA